MGLFDFLQRRKVKRQVDEVMRRSQPRRQYYVYAHYVLRDAAFEIGAACLGVLLSPKRDEFLQDMWRHTTETIREAEPGEPLDPFPGVEVIPLKAGAFPCIVLKMPPPRGVTECYLVGIVAHVDIAAGESPNRQTPVSYFTLERGVAEDLHGTRTVLCEWSREGAHLNYSDGPAPEPELFAEAVAQVIAGRLEPHAAFTPPQPPQN